DAGSPIWRIHWSDLGISTLSPIPSSSNSRVGSCIFSTAAPNEEIRTAQRRYSAALVSRVTRHLGSHRRHLQRGALHHAATVRCHPGRHGQLEPPLASSTRHDPRDG